MKEADTSSSQIFHCFDKSEFDSYVEMESCVSALDKKAWNEMP